ncbi:MAG TPA: PHP domain-containing protein [Anaeromyxobacteraceae bacterium]|nr:PHP domain-containing protein [Anaeromyxobacteraceae bacterium]
MDPIDPIIDLHTHSTASDGQYRPVDVARMVAEAGTQAWALTDHDTVAGLEAADRAARDLNVRFVPGIELSALLDEREVHVLGHFIDPAHPRLREFEDLLAEHRRTRVQKIVRLLAAQGVTVTEDAIVACSGGKTIGRPHVARALLEAGAVSSVKEAFDRWLGEGRPAYVGRFRLTAEDAVTMIRKAGGTATLAHPGVSRVNPRELSRLRQLGFDGVEAGHPDHPGEQAARYREEAAAAGLVCTAGSDFHGEVVAPDRYLGTSRMAAADLDRLEARRP